MSIYVASKTKHAEMWKMYRDVTGWPIISTWIDEAGEGQTKSMTELWERITAEVINSHFLVAYHEPGDDWKGAFVEIGMALAIGRPVFVVGEPPGSWVNHPLVTRKMSLDVITVADSPMDGAF